MCHLTESLLGTHVPLFFNAPELDQDIIKTIQGDFNWVFSPQLTPKEVLDRLSSIAASLGKKVVIMIEAIDEAPRQLFAHELNSLLMRIRDYASIVVCVSCKSIEWGRFGQISGNPSQLTLHTQPSRKPDGSEASPESIVRLEEMRPGLQGRMLNAYRKTFSLSGRSTNALDSFCRLPVNLRIVAEVYQGRDLPDSIDESSLLEAYLRRRTSGMDQEVATNVLAAVAKAIFEKDRSTTRPETYGEAWSIEESDLREQLGLKPSEKLPPELFARDLLVRTGSTIGATRVAFYLGSLRDFVLAVLSLKLPNMNLDDFRTFIPILLSSPTGQWCLAWYSGVAKHSHRDALLEHADARAIQFVETYELAIDRNFPALRDVLEPFSMGAGACGQVQTGRVRSGPRGYTGVVA